MPVNKNAYLRYKVIDNCLTNTGRKYSLKDIWERVNEALIEENSSTSGIEERQLRYDIKALKLPPFNAPIECIQEGKFYYYTYTDPEYSINKVPLNESEANQLQQTVQMLERFIGNENFGWLNELTPMLRDRLGMKEDRRKLISLETDEYNKGKEFVSPIFHAASNKRVLFIKYESFEGYKSEFNFHPYHLKRSNNRWFALGRNDSTENNQWIVPLDRIISLSETKIEYKDYEYEWDEHFSDFIGVTKMEDDPTDILLKFRKEQAKFVITKPIHGEQRVEWQDEETLLVRMKLIPNYELQTKLISFGDKVEILEPVELRETIADRLKAAANQYS